METKMDTGTEVFVCAPGRLRFSNCVFPQGSSVRDVLQRFVQQWAASPHDFYISRDAHVCRLDDHLQGGAVYRLVPRLLGGKGGFGSMLRALGAQIEKTTNREACRDLSGRRLRDVNHEKEMGEWLKQQADREAEREQRRSERLQRKMAEPKHQFSDPAYQQQCHRLAERLEDSVLKGLQAASSSQVTAPKRPGPARCQPPIKKQKTAGACFWTGVDNLSSDDDYDDDDEASADEPSCHAAVMGQEAEPATSNRTPTSPPRLEVQVEKNTPPEKERGVASSCSPGLQHTNVGDDGDAVELAASASDLERLKGEPTARGLKCGGTLSQHAQRLFAVTGLKDEPHRE
ncbi:splicing regulator SDE2 [Phyllopteryx taeniolatus]|uniref:splicing regulator SDE2 n=1 Tax=Phyllopteryx taeniolatus TaxID=161469 RepID=UPI002AD5139F|nr:splicing regulator SDE2 [Phyllopteryx taeniolatus]